MYLYVLLATDVFDFDQDNDDVCTICKNMVTEARDTLRANETQEELKEVFEGSCALIPIKVAFITTSSQSSVKCTYSLTPSFNFQIIRGECDKLVDEFVPELVETLSSEMNPDLVCTTAGLCNSGTQFNRFLLLYSSIRGPTN